MSKLRVATVFSGIGAFEQGLILGNRDFSIEFACDNGERELSISKAEIDEYIKKHNLSGMEKEAYINQLYSNLKKPNKMKESYMANYQSLCKKWFEDIRFIDGKPYQGQIDIFVGGSPCQSFSLMGKRAGLNDVRGTLFYEFARLINEIKPKAFIYENVPGMLIHDNGNTWKVIHDVFESLNYDIKPCAVLNAKDYGIPQNRKRLFVVGFSSKCNFEFPKAKPLEKTMFDFIDNDVDEKYYLGKKGFEFVTNPKYRARATINQDVIRTQKANQQFNWNGDFLFQKGNDFGKKAFIGIWQGEFGAIRQLTPRECLRLMGFPNSYNIAVPDHWAWRQAGNSIVVNVIKAITDEVIKCLR